MNQTIKLNENSLRQIVAESVKNVLKEAGEDRYEEEFFEVSDELKKIYNDLINVTKRMSGNTVMLHDAANNIKKFIERGPMPYSYSDFLRDLSYEGAEDEMPWGDSE